MATKSIRRVDRPGPEARLGQRAGPHVVAERGRAGPVVRRDQIPQRYVAQPEVGRPDGDAVRLVDDAGHDDADRDRVSVLARGASAARSAATVEDRLDHRVGPALGAGRVPRVWRTSPGRVDQGALDARTADVDGDRHVAIICHSRT